MDALHDAPDRSAIRHIATRDSLSTLVRGLATTATDPPNTFRIEHFGAAADSAAAWGMQRFALDVRTADTVAGLKVAGSDLADAMKSIGLPNVNSFLQAAEAQAETNDAASANSSHLGGTSHFNLNEGQAAAEDHILYEVAAGDGTPAPIELQNARHQAVVDQVAGYYRSLGYTVTKDVRFIDDATRKLSIADLVLSVDPIVAATVEGKALITGASGAAIPGFAQLKFWTLVSSTQVYR